MGILNELFRRFSQEEGLSPSNVPIVPRRKKSEQEPLQDDSILRKLADDYESDKTKWVFASDLSELFDHLDLYNQCNAEPSRKIEIKVDSTAAHKLKKAMDAGEHINNGEDLDFDNPSKYIGYAFVNGLVVYCGEKTFDAAYVYTGIESYLSVSMPNGSHTKHYFGLDKPEPIQNLFLNSKPERVGLNHTPVIF